MRRLALFAASQCFGILAICQSAVITPGTAQASPDKPMAPQSLFSFNNAQLGQVGQNFLSTKQGSMPSCDDQDKSRNKASAQVDFDQLFNPSCMNIKPNGVAIARVEMPPFSLAKTIWPDAHFGPIPTQWPDAKFKDIPTTWPDLKMLPIEGQKTNSNPAK